MVELLEGAGEDEEPQRLRMVKVYFWVGAVVKETETTTLWEKSASLGSWHCCHATLGSGKVVVRVNTELEKGMG